LIEIIENPGAEHVTRLPISADYTQADDGNDQP
jgi:hypothetical protein